MSDILNQIPSLAYIEAQIIHRAAKTNALAPSVRAVEREYGLQQGSLGTGVFLESRIVTLLYCLIVVPREIWAVDETHAVYGHIKNLWSIDQVEIVFCKDQDGYQKHPTYHFIRHLRNAMSHANFMMEDGKFTFWDRYNDKAPINFKATLSFEDLIEFLEIVGSLLANLRNAQSV